MYNYNEIKPEIFTEENQKTFLEIRDKVHETIKTGGYITMNDALAGRGSVWLRMAMVDRLVELGEIHEVKQVGVIAGQHRLFKNNTLKT